MLAPAQINLEDVSLHGFPAVPSFSEDGQPVTLYPAVQCDCCDKLYDQFPITLVNDQHPCPFCLKTSNCSGLMTRIWMTRRHMAQLLWQVN